MKLTHEDRGRLSVLTIEGDLTRDTVERFRHAATTRMEDAHVRDFVLDCAHLTLVDSRGLESLLWLQETCAERLGQVRLAACGPRVETILRITRLNGTLETADEVEDAVRELA